MKYKYKYNILKVIGKHYIHWQKNFLKDLNSNRMYQITFKKKITIRPLLKQRHKILLLKVKKPGQEDQLLNQEEKNPFILDAPL